MIKTKGTGGYQFISCDFDEVQNIASDTNAQKLLWETMEKVAKNGKLCLLQTSTSYGISVVPYQIMFAEREDDGVNYQDLLISIQTEIITNPSSFDIDNVNNFMLRIVIERYLDENGEYQYSAVVSPYVYTLTALGD